MVFKFTIDTVLNRYIHPNVVHKIPSKWVRRLLGSHKPPPRDDYWIWLEILVASFCGIALLEGVFKSHTAFTSHNVPIIIASYGATAILCFNAVNAPLAQPRSIFVGHFLASLIGLCIQKLFLLSQAGRENYWASGALSVGVASVAMSICNCVHPPAGASALLPSIDELIQDLSWWYLPVQIISSLLIICVAMISGNIFRSYPSYWWTPSPLKEVKEEKQEPPAAESSSDSDIEGITYVPGLQSIEIQPDMVLVPQGIDIDEIDVDWLEIIRKKVAEVRTPTPPV